MSDLITGEFVMNTGVNGLKFHPSKCLPEAKVHEVWTTYTSEFCCNHFG